MFHKEGYTIIIISFIIIVLIILGLDHYAIKYDLSIKIFLLIVFVLILQFFRNPKFETNSNKNYILSLLMGKL